MTADLGYLVVTGRWDDNVAIVDVAKALDAGNEGADHAVVARPRVTPDIDADGDGQVDARASGQPVAVVVDRASRYAYVVNHSGFATPAAAAAFQHGHPGLIAIVDLRAAIDPGCDGTLEAVAGFIPTGRAGPVGCALTPDGRTLLVNCGEAAGSEDGGDEVTAIDLAARSVVKRITLREDTAHPASQPSRFDSPHSSFGRYPNPTGLVVSPLCGGLAFVGNGGFRNVSVLSLASALAGEGDGEINRIEVETGPFGMAVSPDGRLVAVAARESMSEPYEGRTISLLDVARAAAGGRDAEVARIRVGSDVPAEQTRPFAVAFTPDGKRVVASCFRSGTISFVDVADACAGRPAEVARLYPTVPGGAPSRPRGIALAGGRYACVVGGAKAGPRSSLVWLVDLETARIAATITGVGNESYMLAAFEGA